MTVSSGKARNWISVLIDLGRFILKNKVFDGIDNNRNKDSIANLI